MNRIIEILKSASRRVAGRPDVERWGDARALPFTEGQGVSAPGRIGPASRNG